MDAHQAIITKRDTRQYLPDEVGHEALERVLRAGRMAGSAKNAQLTRIIVVTDEERRRQLATAGDFTSWIHVAPVILVLVAPVEGGRLFDLGRMAQNLMLAAHALGLATCPVTFHHQDRLREAVALSAELEGPMGITLGHPGPVDAGRPRSPRIPLEELVRRETWDGRW